MKEGHSGRQRGFSFVELLVTIVLAGIIFAAMVPMFAGALKKSAADNNRVTATNIAQDRIEKVRLLNYGDITDANLNSSTIGPNWFGTSYTPVGGGHAYTIHYALDTQTNYKAVTVDVTWSETTGAGVTTPHTTTMKTIVMNPAATTSTSGTPTPTPSPSSTTGYYTLTVKVKASDVTSSGVTVVRTDGGSDGTQIIPAYQIPTASNPVFWTMLAGGPDIHYLVTCHCKPGNTVLTMTADLNLMTNYTLYFDTDPGNIFP